MLTSPCLGVTKVWLSLASGVSGNAMPYNARFGLVVKHNTNVFSFSLAE